MGRGTLRTREINQILQAQGWWILRQGKGDHTIWTNGKDTISIDGAPGHEIPLGTLKAAFKIIGIKLEPKTKRKKKK